MGGIIEWDYSDIPVDSYFHLFLIVGGSSSVCRNCHNLLEYHRGTVDVAARGGEDHCGQENEAFQDE